jgi:hypothetical protein
MHSLFWLKESAAREKAATQAVTQAVPQAATQAVPRAARTQKQPARRVCDLSCGELSRFLNARKRAMDSSTNSLVKRRCYEELRAGLRERNARAAARELRSLLETARAAQVDPRLVRNDEHIAQMRDDFQDDCLERPGYVGFVDNSNDHLDNELLFFLSGKTSLFLDYLHGGQHSCR